MKKQIKVAFAQQLDESYNRFGDFNQQVTYYQQYHIDNGVYQLRDNYEFHAKLTYNGFSRGRSALNIEWLDKETGATYQSGMGLLDACLKGTDVVGVSRLFPEGTFQIKGNFTFKKQGTSVLLTFAE